MTAHENGPLAELLEREERLERVRGRFRELAQARAGLVGDLHAAEVEAMRLEGQLRGRGRRRIEWGDLGRPEPLSPECGFDRGDPVDRFYIDQFLARHATDVRGAVLEVADSGYTRRFGADRVERSDVLDVDPTNPLATVVADLQDARAVPCDSYDCLILTQVLQYIPDVRAALHECARLLRPGGVLLATLPAVSKTSRETRVHGDYWRFTAAAARRLFGEVFPTEAVDVQPWGNLLATTAYLYGLARHEVEPAEFALHDPSFPLIVSVRAVGGSGALEGREP